MALEAAYTQFLVQPTDAALDHDASLHYITTLTTFHGQNDILKHLLNQRRSVKKKGEKVLYAVEGDNALAVELETTLEFVSGGGAYLLNLDDNFVSERTVTFPIVHFVQFNGNGKISQVRQHWDQGSLLKQLDVMGRSGRNWPIRDGKEHIKLINASVGATEGAASTSGHPDEVVIRSRSKSNTSATRDPHASLSLFAPHNDDDLPRIPLPRATSTVKPPPRDLGEIFVGHDEHAPSTPTPNVIAPKFGAGKNFTPSRLFRDEEAEDDDEPVPSPLKPKGGSGQNYGPSRIFDADAEVPSSPPLEAPRDLFVKPNPKKYQHFDFGDGSDPTDVPESVSAATDKKSKHSSQWDFSDFVTPQKPVASKAHRRAQEVRHWGNTEDEVDSPVKLPKAGNPRRDAEHHFDFIDDGGSTEGRPLIGRPRGAGHNTGMGLYKNNLYEEDPSAPPPETNENQPRGGIIAKAKDRSKDFDPHFAMTDESPKVKDSKPATIQESKLKAVRMMEPNWESYDQSPAKPAPKAPLSETTNRSGNKGISIAGNGMGGRKGTESSWGFGDEVDEAPQPKPIAGRKRQDQPSQGSFWDF